MLFRSTYTKTIRNTGVNVDTNCFERGDCGPLLAKEIQNVKGDYSKLPLPIFHRDVVTIGEIMNWYFGNDHLSTVFLQKLSDHFTIYECNMPMANAAPVWRPDSLAKKYKGCHLVFPESWDQSRKYTKRNGLGKAIGKGWDTCGGYSVCRYPMAYEIGRAHV